MTVSGSLVFPPKAEINRNLVAEFEFPGPDLGVKLPIKKVVYYTVLRTSEFRPATSSSDFQSLADFND